jgi:hypothetical protein
MKRFIGLSLSITGGAVVLWAGFLALTGKTDAKMHVTDDFSPPALAAGLVGLLICVVGLAWVRD